MMATKFLVWTCKEESDDSHQNMEYCVRNRLRREGEDSSLGNVEFEKISMKKKAKVSSKDEREGNEVLKNW